eukprot:COSAG06_NODE_8003_length_2306_cov_1.574082_3_plen_111_part_00
MDPERPFCFLITDGGDELGAEHVFDVADTIHVMIGDLSGVECKHAVGVHSAVSVVDSFIGRQDRRADSFIGVLFFSPEPCLGNRDQLVALQENGLFLSFPYVCPEPVSVK